MKYLQVDIEVRAEELEPVVGVLLMNDIVETVVEDPLDLERLLNKEVDYEWDYIAPEVLDRQNSQPKVTFYLEDTPENKELAMNAVKAVAEVFPEANIKVAMEDDSEWKDRWKEFFKPKKVGKQIVVKPTWYDYEKQEGDLVIEIDPGMAFGTGTHETTRLCLETLDKIIKDGDTVLDIGCGSGILAIASMLLGATEGFGVDIDELAVKTAKENGKMNGLDEPELKFVCGDLADKVTKQYDVVVANIVADIIILFSTQVRAFMKPGAKFIASGIIDTRADEVVTALQSAGLKLVERIEQGGWVCLVCE